MDKLQRLLEKCRKQKISVVVIGASSGGIDALKIILPAFARPSKLRVALVLHFPKKAKTRVPHLFSEWTDFKIIEPFSGETMAQETIYLAPPDYHLSLESDYTLGLSIESKINFSRPSIDVLFESAAYAFGQNCLGVLLTGANNDGAAGLKTILGQGGLALVQDPEEAAFPEMPMCGKTWAPDAEVFKLGEIHQLIKELNGVNIGS